VINERYIIHEQVPSTAGKLLHINGKITMEVTIISSVVVTFEIGPSCLFQDIGNQHMKQTKLNLWCYLLAESQTWN